MSRQESSVESSCSGVSRFKKAHGSIFIDDVTSELLHLDTVCPRRNKRHCNELEQLGLLTRTGYWTKEEDKLLLNNFHSYLASNPIDDPVRMFNSGIDKEIRKKILETNFYSRLCKNLNRSTKSVYYRIKDFLLNTCKTGHYTDEEKGQLHNLSVKCGKNFKKISIIMNRSQRSINHRYRKNCTKSLKGHWSREEEKQLFHGLRTVMKCQDLGRLRQQSDIKWNEVAKYVDTRDGQQCLGHFRNFKAYKLDRLDSDLQSHPQWKIQNTVTLVAHLYNENCDYESDIDWSELNKLFSDVSPSPLYLQAKFNKLKCRVKDYQVKTYNEIVNCLYDTYCNTSA